MSKRKSTDPTESRSTKPRLSEATGQQNEPGSDAEDDQILTYFLDQFETYGRCTQLHSPAPKEEQKATNQKANDPDAVSAYYMTSQFRKSSANYPRFVQTHLQFTGMNALSSIDESEEYGTPPSQIEESARLEASTHTQSQQSVTSSPVASVFDMINEQPTNEMDQNVYKQYALDYFAKMEQQEPPTLLFSQISLETARRQERTLARRSDLDWLVSQTPTHEFEEDNGQRNDGPRSSQ